MTKSTKASPKADTAIDYDGLLRANAKRVFSEPDVERRLTAVKELWAEDGVLVENEHVAAGWDAVSGSVGALLKMLPPGTTFEAEGRAAGHHGLARLRWRAVDSSGKTARGHGNRHCVCRGRAHREAVCDSGSVITNASTPCRINEDRCASVTACR
jgi:hypothetical protein